MNSEIWDNRTESSVVPTGTWAERKAYRLHMLITRDEDGVYSAVTLNLPGVGSCGETEQEAMANAKDAIREALASYEGEEIPWRDSSSDEIPFGAKQKWIIVNA